MHQNKTIIVLLLSSSTVMLLFSSLFLYSYTAHAAFNTQSLILNNELSSKIVRKQYNLAMYNNNEMSDMDTYDANNDNDIQKANEGSFKSKKGIEVHPANESVKEQNSTEKTQDIPRPGVPDEAKFKELKDRANRNMNTSEEATSVQANSTTPDVS
jgi:hypothetical protein